MPELPTGTVTFLFTDIEGSTELLRRFGDSWGELLATHHRLIRDALGEHGGREVDTQGDAFFAVFPRARDGVSAAVAAQRALASHAWPQNGELRVRMGIHTGEPSSGAEGYVGLDVVRAARICSAAHGGQVLISETTRALIGDALDNIGIRDLGEHRLKDFDEPQRLFQLAVAGPPERFPELRTEGAAEEQRAAMPMNVDALGGRLTETLDGLGPAIERAVQDRLAASGLTIPERRLERKRQSRIPRVSPLALLLGMLVVLPIVYLIVDAF